MTVRRITISGTLKRDLLAAIRGMIPQAFSTFLNKDRAQGETEMANSILALISGIQETPADEFKTVSRPTIEQAWQEYRDNIKKYIEETPGAVADLCYMRACYMSGAAAGISALGIEATKITQPDAVTVTYADLEAAWRKTNRGTPPEPEKPIAQTSSGGPPLHYLIGEWEAVFKWEFTPDQKRRTTEFLLNYKSLRLALTREDFQSLQSIFTQMKWPEQ